MTAFNTAIGNTDDWRQRHNFYFYVSQIKSQKQIVYIPWDYDRLYDEGSDTRGALKGKPWWDIHATATPAACNQSIRSTQAQAETIGGSLATIAWNKDILDQYPPDIDIPVTCDKFTQLMATALGAKIRQRTREMVAQISWTRVRAMWATWNAQIQNALAKDPSGPDYATMLDQQQQLEQHIIVSMAKAINEANLEDGIATPPHLASSVPSFVPKTVASFASPPAFASPPSFASPSFASQTLQSFSNPWG